MFKCHKYLEDARHQNHKNFNVVLYYIMSQHDARIRNSLEARLCFDLLRSFIYLFGRQALETFISIRNYSNS